MRGRHIRRQTRVAVYPVRLSLRQIDALITAGRAYLAVAHRAAAPAQMFSVVQLRDVDSAVDELLLVVEGHGS